MYLLFIIFIFSGLFFGIIVFLWALKSGQFKEQERARYLAIEDDRHDSEDGVSRSGQLQSYVLLGLILVGILISASVVVYAHLI
jgi:cbb3-type cytochrome oxidase maturation protein